MGLLHIARKGISRSPANGEREKKAQKDIQMRCRYGTKYNLLEKEKIELYLSALIFFFLAGDDRLMRLILFKETAEGKPTMKGGRPGGGGGGGVRS